MKISIVGAGNVGGSTALRLAQEKLGDVLLVDIAPGLAKGKAFDLEDAASLVGVDYAVEGSEDIGSLENSDIVVVTAGLARRPGMTREDLLLKNAKIVSDVCAVIRQKAAKAVVITVTNPLDAMTLHALGRLGFPPDRVFGMGPTLDAARFANLIALELKVPVTQVEATVIGSHGEGMLPLARFTRVKGKPLTEALGDPGKREALEKHTVERGKEIVSLLGSGSAYFAPSAAICQIVRAVARDEKQTLAVSTYLEGEYGISGVYLGAPCIIGRGGVEKILELDLNDAELKTLRQSAESVRQQCALLKDQ